MKKYLLACWVLMTFALFAQKPVVGVFKLDCNTSSYLQPEELGNLVRMELERTQAFYVIDKYEIQEAYNTNIASNREVCLSKPCLVQLGQAVKADKMISGSVDTYANSHKIVIQLRVIDVSQNIIEKTNLVEYVHNVSYIQEMLRVSLSKLLDLPIDATLAQNLLLGTTAAQKIGEPQVDRLVLSGPRTGLTLLGGSMASRIQAPTEQGGFNGYPMMMIFGYQKEFQYLNEGRFQALFEVIPAVVGLDQGLASPSLTLLNGFRDNQSGWEFAFGPTMSLVPMARGYYDTNGSWERLLEGQIAPTGVKVSEQLDRRGALGFQSGFLFGVGKSFKTGKVNIPLNVYVVPHKDNWRVGFSFGFNARKTG